MKTTTIQDLKNLLDIAGGRDNQHRRVVFKLLGTAEGYGEKEVKKVYSKEPNSVIVEIA